MRRARARTNDLSEEEEEEEAHGNRILMEEGRDGAGRERWLRRHCESTLYNTLDTVCFCLGDCIVCDTVRD